MLLRENRTYIVGKDCSYGFYLISSKSANSDADFNQYRSIDKSGWYNRTRCYFGCVEVKPPVVCISVENGNAVYIGEEPFDLFETINKATLPEGVFSQTGINVYKNQICGIKAFYRDSSAHAYCGDIFAEIDNQIVFSINDRFYWAFSIDVRSYRNYSDLQICFKSKKLGKSYIFGKNGFTYGYIKGLVFDTEGKDLKYYRINNRDCFIAELPIGVNPSKLRLSWIQPNNSAMRLLPSDRAVADVFSNEYRKLANVLKKYCSLGLEIEIEDEIHLMDKGPDFAGIYASFLEKELSRHDLYVNKCPQNSSKYTFHVGATFDKKYYCAVKLAEKAIDIQANSENTVYYITYNAKQTEEIALMYFNLVSQFNADKDYMIEIQEYLKEYDFFTHLENSINSEIATLREKYGYSSFVTNSVLVHIIKSINKYRRRQLTALYSEMIEEKRVATKWSSEFKLYSIIKSYVPDAVYQYRTGWLGAQSFDIFLPTQRIAIEYQGQQHFEPVDAFGGEANFKNNVERDARKRQLAYEHNVIVIDWNYYSPVRDDAVRVFLLDNHIDISNRCEHKATMPSNDLLLYMAPPTQIEEAPYRKTPTVPPKKESIEVIRQYTTKGCFVKEYSSVREAVDITGISEKSIKHVLYGERKSGGGYCWRRCKRGTPAEDIPPVVFAENTGFGKSVVQMNIDGRTIAVFPSKRAAAEKTSVNVRGISDAIDGIQKTAGGYRWAYFDDTASQKKEQNED